MKNCSFCDAENEDAAVFCEECGNASKLEALKRSRNDNGKLNAN